jgi:TonB family protein
LLIAALCSASLHAQDPRVVDQAELSQHLDHSTPPVYPAIAKAAHIQGTVVFAVLLSSAGRVESLHVVSGPAMLQQAAIDCVKQWTYHPFLKNGVPIPVSSRIAVEFSLGDSTDAIRKDQEISERYFKLDSKCREAVLAHSDLPAAEALCNQVAQIASEFAPDARFIERRSAYDYAAVACLNNHDLDAAYQWAAKAVAVAQLGHDDNSGNNSVYATLGMIEAMRGDLSSADRDLTTAEDFGRKAIAWTKDVKFEHIDSYLSSLTQDLRFHARVLRILNRPQEAQQKLDEADKLQ